MDLQSLRARKAELMESLKESLVNSERIRGAIWFCDEIIGKLEGNGLDVTEVPTDAPAE